MKISEFAEMNNVTTKMLRHYDEIGLLKPASIDNNTGYRSYDASQSGYLNWIIILKNLEFSLAEIKEILNGPIDSGRMINELINKRITISSGMNEQIQKKLQIDRLIKILKEEGFQMNKTIDLLSIEQKSVHEIKKNIPNMEMFLEEAYDIVDLCEKDDSVGVMRFDLWHFKQINDDYGFDVGDNVIVACYNIIKSNLQKAINEPEHKAAMGRTHGDEFVAFIKADKEKIHSIGNAIVEDIKNYDFESLGCMRCVGVYVGGIVSEEKDTVQKIRNMIDSTHEAVERARENGKNSICILD